MEIKYTCPLGSECEQIVGDHIERCRWYITLEGADPQSGDKIADTRCAMEYIPVLQIESSGVLIGVRESVQSMRNETIKRQDAALGVIQNAKLINNK